MAPEDRIPPIPPAEGAGSPDDDDVLEFMGLRQVSEKQSEIEARRALEMIDVDITELRSPTPDEVASGVRAIAADEDDKIEIIEGSSLDAMRRLAAEETKTRPLVQPNVTHRLAPHEVAQVHTRLLGRGLPSSVPPPTNVYMTNQGRYLYVYGLLADQGNMSRVHEALSIDPLDITRPYEVIVKEVADDEIKRAVGDQEVEDDLRSDDDADELLSSQREFATTWVSKTPGSQTIADIERTFQKELAVLRKLRSPHVVRCFGGCKVFEDLGGGRIIAKHVIMLERIRGRNLAQAMADDAEQFTYETLGRLAADLVEALAYLEEKRTYHLDLKPLNVMLDRSGRARLIDFGIARYEHEMFGRRFELEAASILSSPPEMASDVYPRPHRNTDKFGLGVILYYVLTGGDFPYTHEPLEKGEADRVHVGPDRRREESVYEQTEAVDTMREIMRMRRALAAAEQTQPVDSAAEAVRAIQREQVHDDARRKEHIERMARLLSRKKQNFMAREVVPIRLRGTMQHSEITQHLNYLLGTITHSCLLVDPKLRPEFRRLRDLVHEYNALIANLRKDRRVYEAVAVLPLRPVKAPRRPVRIAGLSDLAGVSFTSAF